MSPGMKDDERLCPAGQRGAGLPGFFHFPGEYGRMPFILFFRIEHRPGPVGFAVILQMESIYLSSLNRSKRSTAAPALSEPLADSVISVSVFLPFRGPALTATIRLPIFMFLHLFYSVPVRKAPISFRLVTDGFYFPRYIADQVPASGNGRVPLMCIQLSAVSPDTSPDESDHRVPAPSGAG